MVGGTAGDMQWHSWRYGGGLFDYSVTPGPIFLKFNHEFKVSTLFLTRTLTWTWSLTIFKNEYLCYILVKTWVIWVKLLEKLMQNVKWRF